FPAGYGFLDGEAEVRRPAGRGRFSSTTTAPAGRGPKTWRTNWRRLAPRVAPALAERVPYRVWSGSSKEFLMRYFAGFALAVALFGLAACSTTEEKKEPAKPVTVVMDTSMGPVEIELYPDKAPITVKNFLGYVDDK